MRQVAGNPADWSSSLKSGNVETGPPPPLHPFLETTQWVMVSHAVSAERLVPVARSQEGNIDVLYHQ